MGGKKTPKQIKQQWSHVVMRGISCGRVLQLEDWNKWEGATNKMKVGRRFDSVKLWSAGFAESAHKSRTSWTEGKHVLSSQRETGHQSWSPPCRYWLYLHCMLCALARVDMGNFTGHVGSWDAIWRECLRSCRKCHHLLNSSLMDAVIGAEVHMMRMH